VDNGAHSRTLHWELLSFNYGRNGRYSAVSAGSHPTDHVHPHTIAALMRHQIHVNNVYSKSWTLFSGHTFSKVITVCDQAATEACPVFHSTENKLHWNIPDPAKTHGTEAEIEAAFDQTFNLLKANIEQFLLNK